MKRRALAGISALSLVIAAGSVEVAGEGVAAAQTVDPVVRQQVIPNLRRRPAYTHPVVVSEVSAKLNVTSQVSTTVIEMTLTNPGPVAQEAEVLLPVPGDAAVRSLQYDGVGPEPTAQVLRKEEARRIYEDIVRSMKDPAIMEFAGSNLIRTSAFPIPPGKSQKVTITYEQAVTADLNRVDLMIPRGESQALPVAWKISGVVRADVPISTLYSPSHQIVTERISDREFSFRVVKNEAEDRGTFRLSYIQQPANPHEPSFTVFTYPDDQSGGGYFMILGGLPAPSGDRPSKPREVTVVIDRSGSMRNEKIAQAKEAALQVVAGLKPTDRFNVIDYSDSVSSLAGAPIAADADAVKRATAYITAIEANGGTNIQDALLEALRPPASGEHLPVVLFLTDGLPTVGERNEANIRSAAARANLGARRIFGFGVGFDVNVPLLSTLSESSRGASTFVLPGEDVEVKVGQVYRRLAGPVLSSPTLKHAGLVDGPAPTTDVMPRVLGDVFEGDQVLIFGRYRGDGKVILSLGGEFLGRETAFQISFDPKEASSRNGFVARLWAERKVTSMVDEIRQAGAEGISMEDPRIKELVDEIVRISTRFGILTEYTAFLATESAEFKDADRDGVIDLAKAATSVNLRELAVESRSGEAAVRQQMDYATKQSAAQVANNAMYFGAGVAEVQVRTVQYSADRTFFLRNNRWVDSLALAKEGEKPDREVTVGSAEYMELAALLAGQGRGANLAFDGEVLLQVGTERVLVKP